MVIAVQSEIDVGVARRAAASLCQQGGFPRSEAGCVVTSVSELAYNLWRHAGGGTLTLRLETTETIPWIEIQVEDHGPGIANIALAMQDGYSTTGSLGSGLPGVQRLMDEFSIESALGQGTQVVARKWAKRRR